MSKKFLSSLLICVIVISVLKMTESKSQIHHFRDYETELGREFRESLPRLPRFLKFDKTKDDLKIDLDFLVPFFKIPVKTTQDVVSGISKRMLTSSLGPALLTGSSILARTALKSIIPNLMNFEQVFEKSSKKPKLYPFAESKDVEEDLTVYNVIEYFETLLAQQNIDVTSCSQLIICLVVNKSQRNFLNGKATGVEKFIDGLTGIKWILKQLEGTAVKEAIDIGKSDYGCSRRFRNCQLSKSDITQFIKSF